MLRQCDLPRVGGFREVLAVLQFNREPPNKQDRGNQFDQAINAERKQRERARSDARADRHARLDNHPCQSDVFEAEGFSNERRALGFADTSGQRRCSVTTFRYHAAARDARIHRMDRS